VEGKWFLPERMCTLYGTATWDRLTLEQRLLCSREELAWPIALGVWTEYMLLHMGRPVRLRPRRGDDAAEAAS
jgi:hypothetical protein